jgi:hypothetical protein
MDLLDLLGGRHDPLTRPKQTAPVEMMSEFLILVAEGKVEDALHFTDRILEYEPHNKMILDYKKALASLLQQQHEGTLRTRHLACV